MNLNILSNTLEHFTSGLWKKNRSTEMNHSPLNDPIGSKICTAFSQPNAKWRTIGGISRDSGLPKHQVYDYVTSHQEIFSKAPFSPGGIDVYTLHPLVRLELRNWIKEQESA